MTNGFAPVAAQTASVSAEEPDARRERPQHRLAGRDAPRSRQHDQRDDQADRQEGERELHPDRRAPRPRRPPGRAAGRRDAGRPACAARARAVVESSGNAVSAVGWNRTADGTSGQSAAAAQAAGAGRLARARR